jgi:hypothetical protein
VLTGLLLQRGVGRARMSKRRPGMRRGTRYFAVAKVPGRRAAVPGRLVEFLRGFVVEPGRSFARFVGHASSLTRTSTGRKRYLNQVRRSRTWFTSFSERGAIRNARTWFRERTRFGVSRAG